MNEPFEMTPSPARPPSSKAAGSGAPLASIVVIAYNHLDYTRQCVESIYRYTSHLDFELITINNGSSDGTDEYFRSLPNVKKISFPENVGVCKAINHGFRLAEGKYSLNVSNDIVVTTRWLDNLLACMDDPRIGMAVPVCNASCNYQQVTLPYSSMDELQRAAAAHNVSNPDLWEERLKLSTYAGIYRTDVLKSLGGYDEDFNPGCYDDDAICFSFRRLGHKVILAKDTFVHHFASGTFLQEYEKDKGLGHRNKSTFMRKFAADPYIAGLIDFNVVNLFRYGGAKDANVLGIGNSYGTTLLQVKNVCKSHGSKNPGLYYLAERGFHTRDLETICDDCVVGSLQGEALRRIASRRYHHIVVESESELIENREALFETLYGLLPPCGQLICTAANEKILYQTMGIFHALGAQFDGQRNWYYLCFSKPG